MYSGPNSVEIHNAGDDWAEKRYLTLAKEPGKDSWLVTWKRTETPFGRIWRFPQDGSRDIWQCERVAGEGCSDAYVSRQEALQHLRSQNLDAARAHEREARAQR